MKILLTGCNGQVGREIQRNIPINMDIIACARDSLNISDPEAIQKIIMEHSPQLIINAAAYTAVDKAEEDSVNAFSVNTHGPSFLAKACHQANIPLIHLSTDYVFNGENKIPYQELDVTSPLNVYGHSKWQGEEAIRQNLTKHIILRTSWVFGYFGNNFVKTIVRLAQQKEYLNIVADQMGCPTSAASIAKTIWRIVQLLPNAANDFPWGTYHYVNSPAVSWYDFANSILHQCQKYANFNVKLNPISTDQYPTLAKRPAYSVLNREKISSVFQIEQTLWESEIALVLQELFSETSFKSS